MTIDEHNKEVAASLDPNLAMYCRTNKHDKRHLSTWRMSIDFIYQSSQLKKVYKVMSNLPYFIWNKPNYAIHCVRANIPHIFEPANQISD